MDKKIQIGICGYGNLGKGVESEIVKSADMELAAIFTKRSGIETRSGAPVVHADDAAAWKDKIDVMILCGGSKSGLPRQAPVLAGIFNTVDSFDTHAKILEYLAVLDEKARAGNNISIISAGWDPGLFSLLRLYAGAIIKEGSTYTFWGKGVSQGHSEAIRGLEGVVDAIQYTLPADSAMERVRNGENPVLTAREKHTRECYVAIAEGADARDIESKIKEMPDYFADYDTTVHFIPLEELKRDHAKMTHGGNVIHTGKTGGDNDQVIEFSLKLDSNPEFTASVLVAYARAAYRLSAAGERGARTVFDIAPALLAEAEPEELVRKLM